MSSYWLRKFHFEKILPGGFRWAGMINTAADSEDELYSMEDIKGTFWAEKTNERPGSGWYGKFTLDNGLKPDKRTGEHYELQNLMFSAVYPPEHHLDTENNRDWAKSVLASVNPIQTGIIPRFEGRLEDAICGEETHFWRD